MGVAVLGIVNNKYIVGEYPNDFWNNIEVNVNTKVMTKDMLIAGIRKGVKVENFVVTEDGVLRGIHGATEKYRYKQGLAGYYFLGEDSRGRGWYGIQTVIRGNTIMSQITVVPAKVNATNYVKYGTNVKIEVDGYNNIRTIEGDNFTLMRVNESPRKVDGGTEKVQNSSEKVYTSVDESPKHHSVVLYGVGEYYLVVNYNTSSIGIVNDSIKAAWVDARAIESMISGGFVIANVESSSLGSVRVKRKVSGRFGKFIACQSLDGKVLQVITFSVNKDNTAVKVRVIAVEPDKFSSDDWKVFSGEILNASVVGTSIVNGYGIVKVSGRLSGVSGGVFVGVELAESIKSPIFSTDVIIPASAVKKNDKSKLSARLTKIVNFLSDTQFNRNVAIIKFKWNYEKGVRCLYYMGHYMDITPDIDVLEVLQGRKEDFVAVRDNDVKCLYDFGIEIDNLRYEVNGDSVTFVSKSSLEESRLTIDADTETEDSTNEYHLYAVCELDDGIYYSLTPYRDGTRSVNDLNKTYEGDCVVNGFSSIVFDTELEWRCKAMNSEFIGKSHRLDVPKAFGAKNANRLLPSWLYEYVTYVDSGKREFSETNLNLVGKDNDKYFVAAIGAGEYEGFVLREEHFIELAKRGLDNCVYREKFGIITLGSSLDDLSVWNRNKRTMLISYGLVAGDEYFYADMSSNGDEYSIDVDYVLADSDLVRSACNYDDFKKFEGGIYSVLCNDMNQDKNRYAEFYGLAEDAEALLNKKSTVGILHEIYDYGGAALCCGVTATGGVKDVDKYVASGFNTIPVSRLDKISRAGEVELFICGVTYNRSLVCVGFCHGSSTSWFGVLTFDNIRSLFKKNGFTFGNAELLSNGDVVVKNVSREHYFMYDKREEGHVYVSDGVEVIDLKLNDTVIDDGLESVVVSLAGVHKYSAKSVDYVSFRISKDKYMLTTIDSIEN